MTYDFTLDKKALVSVLAGWIVMALLLFAAGLIVGTYWSTSGPGASVATAKTTTDANARASLPREPVLTNESDSLDAAAPTKDGNAKSQSPTTGQGPAPAQTAAAAADDLNKKAAVPPVPEFSEKANQENALAPPAAATSENSAGGPGTFTVQVGVFLEQNEASRLLKEMERKGYAPSFFADRDSEDRQWYAVRIGAYSDKDQAANAAANLSKQERVKAVVRPLGSL
jgi:cell division septation protein DedD